MSEAKTSPLIVEPTMKQFRRFGTVGILGFCIDGGILLFLVQFGSNPNVARLVSFAIAVSITWYLNRAWTFVTPRYDSNRGKQYLVYLGVQIAGALTNYICYAAVLFFVRVTPA